MTKTIVIDTALGKIRGKVAANYLGDKYYSFQGISYAKAPVGKLRFKAPVPIDAWNGELNATKQGQACPSLNLLFKIAEGNEDNCLNLNINIKELPEPAVPLKPVMVWIHGGGFVVGSNSSTVYDPEYLMTENVVQVSINYRLGLLGFLSLEDESLGVPGNAGFKDQVMALRWVKNNISSFGGNPNNVTVYGQSAGAASVQYLMLSPLAEGLFHKAIMQSGGFLCPWATKGGGEKALAKCLNIEENDEANLLEVLQNMTTKEVLNIQTKIPDRTVAAFRRPFGAVIEKPSDQAFLSDDPLQLLKSGKYKKIPIIIGATSNEAAFYSLFKQFDTSNWKFDSTMEIPWDLKISLNDAEVAEIITKIYEFYNLKEDMSEENTYDLKSDNFIVHSNHRFLQYYLHSSNQPVYCYTFSFVGIYNHSKYISCSNYPKTYLSLRYLASLCGENYIGNILSKMAFATGFRKVSGSAHTDELYYLFRCVLNGQMEPDSREEKTMKRLVKLWTNFAKYDNPTPENDEDGLGIRWIPAEKKIIIFWILRMS
ncbi:hypothetical protein WA026_007855 [Henosepilachna vigintioctopunctata]|uniref:Carboxylic ester hydrolase n=1 Tax=Henosepilachna vigintioctopunctata TaxID=420089 RepID=A0AAW1U6E2_9CUCU